MLVAPPTLRRPRATVVALIWALAAWLYAPTSAWAQTTDHLRQQLEGVDVVEQLGAEVPAELSFVDTTGKSVALESYRGRPVLLTLNYTSCKMLCSLQLAGLAKTVKTLKWRPSERFDIVTVSVDPDEKPARALRTKQRYVQQAGGTAEVGRGWHFLTGAQDNISALAESVGFHYRLDPETGEYRHKATVIVLTADGQVSSYLHGITYDPVQLQQALQRAARNEVLNQEEQTGLGGFLLNCFSFDGSGEAPLALTIVRAGGALAMLFIIGFLGYYGLRDVRRRRADRQT